MDFEALPQPVHRLPEPGLGKASVGHVIEIVAATLVEHQAQRAAGVPVQREV